MCPPVCLIHVCHNSFKKGLAQCGHNAEEMCLNLYLFFKKTPCRKFELFKVGPDELVAVQALQWFLVVKEALKKLLLEEMPKNDKNITKNDKYMAIKKV